MSEEKSNAALGAISAQIAEIREDVQRIRIRVSAQGISHREPISLGRGDEAIGRYLSKVVPVRELKEILRLHPGKLDLHNVEIKLEPNDVIMLMIHEGRVDQHHQDERTTFWRAMLDFTDRNGFYLKHTNED